MTTFDAIGWGMFWIYATWMLFYAFRNLYRNIMHLTQLPFKLAWLRFLWNWHVRDRAENKLACN